MRDTFAIWQVYLFGVMDTIFLDIEFISGRYTGIVVSCLHIK